MPSIRFNKTIFSPSNGLPKGEIERLGKLSKGIIGGVFIVELSRGRKRVGLDGGTRGF
jgi:hypothetical protein